MEGDSIEGYVFGLGISPGLKGFAYICRVAEAMQMGSGYSSACERLCAETGVCRRTAERCIRYAVAAAWDGRPAAIRKLFPYPESGCAPPPKLAEFFFALALFVRAHEEKSGG